MGANTVLDLGETAYPDFTLKTQLLWTLEWIPEVAEHTQASHIAYIHICILYGASRVSEIIASSRHTA